MNDLLAKFLPRFTKLAMTRLQHAVAIAAARRHEEAKAVADELHSMAGEAGLLGVAPVLEAARRAETAAKKYHASGAEADAAALSAVLADLDAALAGVVAEMSSSQGTGP